MKTLIYGTGAVGAYLGVKLALAGDSVTFLARPRIVQDFQNGVEISGDDDPGTIRSPRVVETLAAALEYETPDVIYLTVKAYDVADAASHIADKLPRSTAVLSLTNGIGSLDLLSQTLHSDQIIPATLTTAVQLFPQGNIKVARRRGLGLAGNHPLIPALLHDLDKAGFRTQFNSDPRSLKWSKLLTNIISNCTSAILNMPPTLVFQNRFLFRLEVEALREALKIMRALNIQVVNLPGVPIRLMATLLRFPAFLIRPILTRAITGGRGEKMPSFHGDVGRGRSEVEWLNGAIVREGQELGIPTPANQVLLDTLLDLVHNRVQPKEFAQQPGSLLRLARDARVPGM
jgi:2-dehydropantoate 2-reductase